MSLLPNTLHHSVFLAGQCDHDLSVVDKGRGVVTTSIVWAARTIRIIESPMRFGVDKLHIDLSTHLTA